MRPFLQGIDILSPRSSLAHLVPVHVDPEGVGVAAVVEEEQGREEGGAELHCLGGRDSSQGGVGDNAADLERVFIGRCRYLLFLV